jgi:hypothetical protein
MVSEMLPSALCKLRIVSLLCIQTNTVYSGGLAEGVKGTAEGAFSAGASLLGGAVDAGKGVLGGVGDALGGVFGVGGDLVEAITGLRPWRATDIEQLNEIRAAIRPIVKRYAARQ